VVVRLAATGPPDPFCGLVVRPVAFALFAAGRQRILSLAGFSSISPGTGRLAGRSALAAIRDALPAIAPEPTAARSGG
jgi:hypothetical protein